MPGQNRSASEQVPILLGMASRGVKSDAVEIKP